MKVASLVVLKVELLVVQMAQWLVVMLVVQKVIKRVS